MLDRNALKRQQLVLKHLGYYNGEIDGIWSQKSIEAKIQFERSGVFNPGIPNNGMPFNTNVRLPIGIGIDAKGYLTVIGVDLDRDKLVDNTQQRVTKSTIAQKQNPQQKSQQQKADTSTEVSVKLEDLK